MYKPALRIRFVEVIRPKLKSTGIVANGDIIGELFEIEQFSEGYPDLYIKLRQDSYQRHVFVRGEPAVEYVFFARSTDNTDFLINFINIKAPADKILDRITASLDDMRSVQYVIDTANAQYKRFKKGLKQRDADYLSVTLAPVSDVTTGGAKKAVSTQIELFLGEQL